MVEFANPRHKHRFLVKADEARTITRGETTVGSGNVAVGGLGSKGSIGGSSGFDTACQQAPYWKSAGSVKKVNKSPPCAVVVEVVGRNFGE